MRNDKSLSLGQSLAIVAGGIAGGAAGWLFAEQSLAPIAQAAGRSLGADHRGPVLLGYLLMGWLAGTFVSYFLVRLFARRDKASDES